MPAPARSWSSTTPIAASRACSTPTSRWPSSSSPAEPPTRPGPGSRASPPATPSSSSTATLPLLSAETISALVDAHERAVAAATIGTVDPRRPERLRPRRPRPRRHGASAWSRPRRRATRPTLELQIREVNTGLFAFDGDALLVALDQVDSDNAQGELYLPDVLPILRGPSAGRSSPTASMTRSEMLGINDRVALADVTAVAQRRIHEHHMLAGRDDRQPGRDRDRRRRRDRPGHGDRTVLEPPRRHADRRRARRSGRSAR